MTPERWQKIKVIFDAASELAHSKREVYLAETCADDPGLRAEVETLLSSHERARDFIETPAIENADTLSDQPFDSVSSLTERRIGPYKLVRELGHGGMGTVYLAVRDDAQYQKRVALKLVKPGLNTSDILRRFRYERQILASLDHFNIAKLLDGGTTSDGMPYFVMEYIEGLPITEHCDRHKFSTEDRLKLFRQACSAVGYAHQNLIVHRDIKPSNILITADGVPKLLDFGIAKLLNPELSAHTIDPTATALRLMTPEYASPEQVRGETITTASDVYSLGVVLYELLTGHRPFRFKSRLPSDILRIVCEEEPEKPSTVVSRIEAETNSDGSLRSSLTPEIVSRTREGLPEKLRRRLQGDVDNIVMMSLRKEPQRRYVTVDQLSEDIRRHLEGLPVIARPNTLGYQLQKLVKRNKVAAIAVALVFFSLSGGLAATLWQARIAQRERAKAQQRFDDVRGLATSFLFEINNEIAPLPGTTRARQKLVNKALETYDKLAKQAGDDPSLQLDLADAYRMVSDIQWNRYYAHLGEADKSMQSARKALGIYEKLSVDPKHLRAYQGLGYSYVQVGDLLINQEKTTEALDYYRKSTKIRENIVAAEPANVDARHNLMVGYQRVGDTLGNPEFPNLGDKAGALDSYLKMLRIQEEMAAEAPNNPDYQHTVRIGYEKIRDIRWALGDRKTAFEIYQKALEIDEKLVTNYPDNAQYRRDLAVGYEKLGDMLETTGDTTSALARYRQALDIRQALATLDPKNAKAHDDLILIHNSIGNLFLKTGNKAGAAEHIRQALALRKILAERSGATANDLNAYAWDLLTIEPANLRDPIIALSCAKRAVDITLGKDPNLLDTLAYAYFLTGDRQRAIQTQEQALSLLSPNATNRHEFEERLQSFKNLAKNK